MFTSGHHHGHCCSPAERAASDGLGLGVFMAWGIQGGTAQTTAEKRDCENRALSRVMKVLIPEPRAGDGRFPNCFHGKANFDSNFETMRFRNLVALSTFLRAWYL
jgi:hypothetical protein